MHFKMKYVVASVCLFVGVSAADEMRWVTYPGGDGPGKDKHIVLLSGDEEYRSEEALPMLGQILSVRHGFKCTVLFALAEDGTIDPNNQSNIPGLQAIESADLIIMSWRFRKPAEGMQYIDAYVRAGKPIVGLRTSTHAFNGLRGEYERYNNGYAGPEWKGGFGREILGEKWISHHGHHGREGTRGIITDAGREHPILTGVKESEIWGTTDVYGVRLPLPGDSVPLVLGQVVNGMEKDAPATEGKKNDPMMPVCWVKTYQGDDGQTGRVFTTTMGASEDFVEPGLRRIVINAAYWCLGMEDEIKPDSSIKFVAKYEPTRFGFRNKPGYWKKIGHRPADFALKIAE